MKGGRLEMYENMTRIELEARLHFLEVNAGHTASELRKANERIEKLTEKTKSLMNLSRNTKPIMTGSVSFSSRRRKDSSGKDLKGSSLKLRDSCPSSDFGPT